MKLNTILSDEERKRFQDPHMIQEVLRNARVIAIVGMSADTSKASNMVGTYLRDHGYRIIPVNPRYEGEELNGEKVYAKLSDIPIHIDLVNVFRPSAEISAIVDQAIAIKADAVWTQIMLIDTEASERALHAGLKVVVDKCSKVEHARYFAK